MAMKKFYALLEPRHGIMQVFPYPQNDKAAAKPN